MRVETVQFVTIRSQRGYRLATGIWSRVIYVELKIMNDIACTHSASKLHTAEVGVTCHGSQDDYQLDFFHFSGMLDLKVDSLPPLFCVFLGDVK